MESGCNKDAKKFSFYYFGLLGVDILTVVTVSMFCAADIKWEWDCH